MTEYINATDAAIGILETARLAVVAERGIGAVSSVLWRAQMVLQADARRVMTGAVR